MNAVSGAGRPHIFRIMTYNVHRCIGTDRRLDPARIADVIAASEPDIVALQELDVGRHRTGGVDQAVAIARHLSMESHFHPAMHVEEEKYGDAILSRFPSHLIKAAALPSLGEPRGALAVKIDVGGAAVAVVNTHLGLRRRERIIQADTLLGPAWLKHQEVVHLPTILMGDFNAMPRSAAYNAIAGRLTDAAASAAGRARATFPSRIPMLRIDHIFLSAGLSALNTSVESSRTAKTASDHLPLVASVSLL
ncbi:endonuclease/exonuclease/phosphatase family protein [Fodinicurvata sp. EGI_FJ10296]|uniref:endonuclease/exonuclease/phosphatase family protein n=1 Tax=Fodinicurvata sp. EGI_FJ10296 TaxID=3231908 RepID=UPI003456CC18